MAKQIFDESVWTKYPVCPHCSIEILHWGDQLDAIIGNGTKWKIQCVCTKSFKVESRFDKSLALDFKTEKL